MTTASELARSGPLPQPRICCLDLDTFFVSVERVLDPDAGGQAGGRRRPAGQPRRGDGRQLRGAAAGREVGHVAGRGGQAGARTPSTCRPAATPTARTPTACARSPGATRPPSLVASIDEMFLDLSGCERLYGRPGDDQRRPRHRARGAGADRRDRQRAGAAGQRRPGHQQGDGEGGLQPGQAARGDAGPGGRRARGAGAAAGAVVPGHRPGRRGQAAGGRATRRWARSPRRPIDGAAQDLRRLGAVDPAGRAGPGLGRRSGASARRSRSTIPRARPSAASPTSGRFARTCPIRRRSNRSCAGCASASAGGRASATSRRAP